MDIELLRKALELKNEGEVRSSEVAGEKETSNTSSEPSILDLTTSTFPRLFKFQSTNKDVIKHKLMELNQPADLLIAKTGHGKTYILGGLLKDLFDTGWFNKFPPTAIKVLYVTKATVVTQTERVLCEFGLNASSGKSIGTDIFITNYDQLRAKLGELIIRDYTEIIHGEPVIKFEWWENLTPVLVIWDECHSLMNPESIQSKIAQALNDLPAERLQFVYQIFTSATPFSRVSEAKCFAVATRTKFKYGFISSPLSNQHWNDFSHDVSYPSLPNEHNIAACKRLMERLEGFITRVKGVKPKFHERNSTCLIDFETAREQQLYAIAFEEYQEFLRKHQGRELEGLAKIWVAMMKFAQAAELIKAPTFAKCAHEDVKRGKAVIIAVKFRATIARITEKLVNDYGYIREEISLIWGGIDDVKELKEEYQDLDLGPQSRTARQREIDKFQGRGDYKSSPSKICIFSYKAGGAGLSLHHEAPHLKQRTTWCSVTYSEKEMIQGLGRGPRLTSLSDTEQTMLFYRGTIEEAIKDKCDMKLRCSHEVVSGGSGRESWTDILTKVKEIPTGEAEEMEEEDVSEDTEGEVIDI